MENLIDDIKQDTINSAFLTGVKRIDAKIIAAIKSIDRSHFVRPQESIFAYENQPLSIGHGQTISQPFIVALMIHLLEPKAQDKALEVGSGCGYAAAVLSRLCSKVYGLEIIEPLAKKSRQLLQAEKINNVEIIYSDGTKGLKAHAPFDKILVSAGANSLPQVLLEQLEIGGIMVLPKTCSPTEQMLIRIEKNSATEFLMKDIIPVRFVPLVGS